MRLERLEIPALESHMEILQICLWTFMCCIARSQRQQWVMTSLQYLLNRGMSCPKDGFRSVLFRFMTNPPFVQPQNWTSTDRAEHLPKQLHNEDLWKKCVSMLDLDLWFWQSCFFLVLEIGQWVEWSVFGRFGRQFCLMLSTDGDTLVDVGRTFGHCFGEASAEKCECGIGPDI